MIRFQQDSSRSVLWQVLAPYVRWPLHSPKRLLLTAFVVLALFAACGRLQGSNAPGSPVAGSTTTVAATPAPAWTREGPDGRVTVSEGPVDPSATSAGTTEPTPAVPTDPSAGVTSAPIVTTAPSVSAPAPSVARPGAFTPPPRAGEPVAVAEQFVTAWARRGAEVGDWRRGVTPYITSAFGAELLTIDPDRIPATKRTGKGTASSRTPQAVTVTVPTDGVPVVVTVKRVGAAWLASDIEPVAVAEAAPTPDLTSTPSPTAGPTP